MSATPIKVAGPLRLAIRNEDPEWVTFHVADINTMEGALLVATIQRGILDARPALFAAIKEELYALVLEFTVRECGADPATVERQYWPGGLDRGGKES